LVQKLRQLKNIKIIIGCIAIVFAGYRFFNITNPTPLFVMYPGIAILAISIVTILKGFLIKENKTVKSIDIGIGITGIAVGLFIKFILIDTSSSSNPLIFLFLIIQGAGFVVEGIALRNKTKAIRIPKTIIGISVIPVIVISLTNPDLSLILITGVLSFKLLFVGIEIIEDMDGNKISKRT